MVRRADRNVRETTRCGEVGAELSVVDRLVHADVERLTPRGRVAKRGGDRIDEILDVHEVALYRPTLRIEHDGHRAVRDIRIGLRDGDEVPPARTAEDVVAEGQLKTKVVLLHDPRRAQAADVQVVLDAVLLDHHLLEHLRDRVAARIRRMRVGSR